MSDFYWYRSAEVHAFGIDPVHRFCLFLLKLIVEGHALNHLVMREGAFPAPGLVASELWTIGYPVSPVET